MQVIGEVVLGDNRERVRAQVAAHTDQGRRRGENQDNFLISDLAAENGVVLRPDAHGNHVAADIAIGESGALLLVADGMGGAAAGRLASGLACTCVLAALHESWLADRNNTPRQFALRLREAVEKANQYIFDYAARNPECAGMGTTATAGGVFEDFLYIAQVGDSRAYLVRAGAATQITRDQSYVQEMLDAGVMTEEEAEQTAHGSVILQALGTRQDVQVELTFQALRRGDLIILCSDGLHRMVRPAELAAAAEAAASPASLCRELVALANERGGPDNVTVVAARLDGDALPAAADGDVVRRQVLVVD